MRNFLRGEREPVPGSAVDDSLVPPLASEEADSEAVPS